MPELPEVTVIVDQLNKKLKGLVLESIEYDWPKKFFWNDFSIKDLKGKRVEKVERIGKVVKIDLANGMVGKWDGGQDKKLKKPTILQSHYPKNLSILIHLKLTGQLIYQDKKTRVAGGHPIPPLNLPVPNKTTRVIFTLHDGPTSLSTSLKELRGSRRLRGTGHLYFNDLRKFGWVKIVQSDGSKIKEAIGAELGPDPLVMSYEEFRERLVKRGQARIKKLLMDQEFIAGIGNIYSDEALWRAKIHPRRSATSLKTYEIKALYEGIQDSLKLAIDKGGSSANAFVDSGGERGLYLSYARAYHMTGKPCSRCGTLIVREKLDGRSAHFCPRCQRLK